jgi:hypothetical protein
MNNRRTKKAWKLYFEQRKLRSGMHQIVRHGMTLWATLKEKEVMKRCSAKKGYNFSIPHN